MPSDHDLLIQIDTKLDASLALQQDQETRIRRLESLSSKMLGMAVIVSLVLGFALDWAKKKVFGG